MQTESFGRKKRLVMRAIQILQRLSSDLSIGETNGSRMSHANPQLLVDGLEHLNRQWLGLFVLTCHMVNCFNGIAVSSFDRRYLGVSGILNRKTRMTVKNNDNAPMEICVYRLLWSEGINGWLLWRRVIPSHILVASACAQCGVRWTAIVCQEYPGDQGNN